MTPRWIFENSFIVDTIQWAQSLWEHLPMRPTSCDRETFPV